MSAAHQLPSLNAHEGKTKDEGRVDDVDISLKLESYITQHSSVVRTSDPDRLTYRRIQIGDSVCASSFCNLHFTGDGTTILMHIEHRDGHATIVPLDSANFDELIITWNDSVAIELENFNKKTTVKHYGKMHVIAIF